MGALCVFVCSNTAWFLNGVSVDCVGLTALHKIAKTKHVCKCKQQQIFALWVQKHCNILELSVTSGVLGHAKLKNIAVCSGFCLPERKNTPNKRCLEVREASTGPFAEFDKWPGEGVSKTQKRTLGHLLVSSKVSFGFHTTFQKS